MDSRRDETYEVKDCWKVIESYFANQHLQQLVKHQVESYNDFIQNQMKRTIQMFGALAEPWSRSRHKPPSLQMPPLHSWLMEWLLSSRFGPSNQASTSLVAAWIPWRSTRWHAVLSSLG